MKYMNNHYGQSRIFKNARFILDPRSRIMFAPDDGASGGNGGGSGDSGDGAGGEGTDGGGEDASLDMLKAALAEAQAEREKLKNSIDKLTKQNGELTKKNREHMTAEQIAQEAQEERDKRFAEMEKELRNNKYSKRLVGMGMAEADADTFADLLPDIEDSDSFFDTLGAFIKAREKAASDNAVQELLKSRPDINAGHGDSDKDDQAMLLAKRAVSVKKERSSSENRENILKNYI